MKCTMRSEPFDHLTLAEEFLRVVLSDRRGAAGHRPFDGIGAEALRDRDDLDGMRPRSLDRIDRCSQPGELDRKVAAEGRDRRRFRR